MLYRTFERTLEHYSRLAVQKGYYAYARQEVHELDADPLYRGLRAAVADNIKGFVVPLDERGQWWNIKSEAEQGYETFKKRN
tara:strand:+ start:34 stop:279 length:246 start_codon:yes stop_codon:yes gene_type:complete